MIKINNSRARKNKYVVRDDSVSFFFYLFAVYFFILTFISNPPLLTRTSRFVENFNIYNFKRGTMGRQKWELRVKKKPQLCKNYEDTRAPLGIQQLNRRSSMNGKIESPLSAVFRASVILLIEFIRERGPIVF